MLITSLHGFGLPIRKQFAAKVIRLENLDRLVSIPRHQTHVNSLISLYDISMNSLNRDRLDDTVPLDTFLERLWGSLLIIWEANEQIQPQHGQFLNYVKKGLLDDMQLINCSRCHKTVGIGHKCNGSLRDYNLVTQRGECLISLIKCFAFALQTAERWYRTYSTYLSSQNQIPPVGLALVGVFDRPLSSPQWAVNAFTNFHMISTGDTPLQTRIVQLSIATIDIKWEEYQSLLYVFFHECVAHAFEGLLPSFREYPISESESWTEGWMDWVAFNLLKETLKEVEQQDASDDSQPRWPSECIKYGETLYNALGNPSTKGCRHPEYMLQRWEGRKLAEQFYKLTNVMQLDPTDPRRPFYQLSADLNLRSDTNRYVLFTRLYDRMFDMHSSEVRPDAIEWAKSILEEYWNSTNIEGKQDINVLIHAIS